MKAEQLIRRALASVRVVGIGETVDPEMMVEGLASLNQLLGWLGANNFITYRFEALADDLGLPDGWDLLLETNLAVLIAPRYGKEASASVQRLAVSTRRVLGRRLSEPPRLSLDVERAISTSGPGNYDILTNNYVR